MRRFRIPLALAATLLAVSTPCQMLYHTGFETPNYTLGQSIDGVDGWFSFISPNAVEVVQGATAHHGRRAISCWGGSPDLQSTQGLLDGAWARNATLDPAYGNNVVVFVSANVRLEGPDTGTGPADDLVSANLYARNGVGGSAWFYVSSTGDAYCFAESAGGSAGYRFPTPVVLGQYVNLTIALDYTTHQATYYVNFARVGSLPFGGQPGERFNGAIMEFAAYDDPQIVDPTLYTGSWDDVVIFALPVTN